MKVTTWYEPPTEELEVEITVEDITRALNEAPDTPFAAMQMMNAAAQSMKATTDEIIAEINPTQREVVANFLIEQAARFLCENVKGHAPLAESGRGQHGKGGSHE